MDQKLLKEIIRSLQNKVKCPVCGHSFNDSEIRFKGAYQDIFFFEFNCPVCSTGLFAKVLVDRMNLPENTGQSIKLKDFSQNTTLPQGKITTNQIIEAHQALGSFDGDLTELFS